MSHSQSGFSFPTNAARAQDTLAVSAVKVTVDGAVDPSEYAYSFETKGMKLFLTRTSTSLYAALRADTNGWVGIGFKSDKMDAAEILIGYYKDGNGTLFEHLGQGKKHNEKNIPYLKTFAFTEHGTTTVLEVESKPTAWSRRGRRRFPSSWRTGATTRSRATTRRGRR